MLLARLTLRSESRYEFAYLHDDGTILLIGVEVLVGVSVAALESVRRNLGWRSLLACRKLECPLGQIDVVSRSTVGVQRGGEGQGAEHRDSVGSETHFVYFREVNRVWRV